MRQIDLSFEMGIGLNVLRLLILWLGGALPPHTQLGPDGFSALDNPTRGCSDGEK
jgi:hypothetical protein